MPIETPISFTVSEMAEADPTFSGDDEAGP